MHYIMQIIISVLLLVLMVLLLLSINHFLRCDDSLTQRETERYKREVDNAENVISKRSVFHKFLARK